MTDIPQTIVPTISFTPTCHINKRARLGKHGHLSNTNPLSKTESNKSTEPWENKLGAHGNNTFLQTRPPYVLV